MPAYLEDVWFKLNWQNYQDVVIYNDIIIVIFIDTHILSLTSMYTTEKRPLSQRFILYGNVPVEHTILSTPGTITYAKAWSYDYSNKSSI